MRMKIEFRVEKKTAHGNWMIIPFTGGSRAYCKGYAHALDDMYPSPKIRIVRIKDLEVISEHGGRSAPKGMHTN